MTRYDVAGVGRGLHGRDVVAVRVPALEASSNFNRQGGVHAATHLLTTQRPTAVVAGADPIAFGVLDAARKLGLSVPDDLSIVGFDDLPQTAHTVPPLTTVSQPLHEM